MRQRPSSKRCPLILDGLCLHVLSSFQRTGEPASGPRPPPAISSRRRTFQIYDSRSPVNDFSSTSFRRIQALLLIDRRMAAPAAFRNVWVRLGRTVSGPFEL